jgi:hypothetical protein
MAQMKPILILPVAHRQQRYDTCGDWQNRQFCSVLNYHDPSKGWNGPMTTLRISWLKDWRYMLLVAVHELVEWALCKHRNVKEKDVDRFDTDFTGCGEPGDDPKAPYHREHVFATKIERLLANELGVDWNAYDSAINQLGR